MRHINTLIVLLSILAIQSICSENTFTMNMRHLKYLNYVSTGDNSGRVGGHGRGITGGYSDELLCHVDLNGLNGATINNVEFRFNVANINSGYYSCTAVLYEQNKGPFNENAKYLTYVDDAWSNSLGDKSLSFSASNGWYPISSVSLKNLIQDWVNGSKQNNGFVLGGNFGNWDFYWDISQVELFVEYTLPNGVSLSVTINGYGFVDPFAGTYSPGEEVTLTATPSSCNLFDGWIINGTDAGNTNPLTIIMDEDKEITAKFKHDQTCPPPSQESPVFENVTVENTLRTYNSMLLMPPYQVTPYISMSQQGLYLGMKGQAGSSTGLLRGEILLSSMYTGISTIKGGDINTEDIVTNTLSSRTISSESLETEVLTVSLYAFPDDVFTKDYNLKSLEEIEKYISQYGHLSGIPTEREVKSKGLNIGEINTKLLEKIEEMTLHMIRMNKNIQKMQEKIDEIETLK